MDKQTALNTLEQALEALLSQEGIRRFLEIRKSLHQYSFYNVLMIATQKPAATMVAGYQRWKALNRQVRKGKKGIAIFIPHFRKAPAEPHADALGTDELPRTLVGFGVGHVFDVSQTDGKPIGEWPEPAKLTGSDQGLQARLHQVAESFGLVVLDEAPESPTAQGDFSHSTRTIRVRPTNEPKQRAKTLAHEIGHALLHKPGDGLARDQKELEAESVAYIVMASQELDSAAYTLPYLAGWNGDLPTLKARGLMPFVLRFLPKWKKKL
ncbi:MAG: ImmA/IrrE family metallo-endopeptidase [Acidobacteria bacterium]|nr:ImmA/IrrE family metallo-endopeptidase [Acidobacteriota bacterium]MBI3656480.1 ImmA/IrrE family metallo-endopeptidase [Acidobacteriota bacterium]